MKNLTFPAMSYPSNPDYAPVVDSSLESRPEYSKQTCNSLSPSYIHADQAPLNTSTPSYPHYPGYSSVQTLVSNVPTKIAHCTPNYSYETKNQESVTTPRKFYPYHSGHASNHTLASKTSTTTADFIPNHSYETNKHQLPHQQQTHTTLIVEHPFVHSHLIFRQQFLMPY